MLCDLNFQSIFDQGFDVGYTSVLMLWNVTAVELFGVLQVEEYPTFSWARICLLS